MAVKQVSISKTHTVYPELVWQTNGQATLSTGNQQIFKLDKISRNQIVKPLKLGMEAHDNSFYSMIFDGVKRSDSIHTLSTGGINTPVELGHDHEIGFANEELICQIANNGSADTDNRQSIQYYVDAADTIRKIQQGFPLEEADNAAIEYLNRHQEVAQMDPRIAAKLGIAVPKSVGALNQLHEHIGSVIQDLGRGVNLSSTEQNVCSEEIVNTGEEALVLEKILVDRTTQAETGEVSIKVYRDDDATALLTLDPASLPGAPFTTDGNTSATQNVSSVELHIPAFDKLKVTASTASGTHNSFICTAMLSRRKIGIGWKAKLQEFLGSNALPVEIDISSKEQALIDQLGLQQLARTGLIQIG